MKNQQIRLPLLLGSVVGVILFLLCGCGSMAGKNTDHTLVQVAAKASTCTEEGNIAYQRCTDCGKLFDEQGNELTPEQTVVAVLEHRYELQLAAAPKKVAYVEGETFDQDGMIVKKCCRNCGFSQEVPYTVETKNEGKLTADIQSVTIVWEGMSLEVPITVQRQVCRIACVGDSLTAGHSWPNESYPVYLQTILGDRYEVGNFGVNGISATGYGGSWNNPNAKYRVQDVYTRSLAFKPDVVTILLGTNDATGWSQAADCFESEYKELIQSYRAALPNAQIIVLVSPPVKNGNPFWIPNDKIRDKVNPIQRQVAQELGLTMLDLRELFENYTGGYNRFLRDGDGVHLSNEGAQFVAETMAQAIEARMG